MPNTCLKALRYRLINNAAVSTQISSRLYRANDVPSSDDGKTYPYGTIRTTGHVAECGLSGAVRYATDTVQLDWYAITDDGAWDLAELARLALDGYRGVVTVDGAQCGIMSCPMAGMQEEVEPALPGSKDRIGHVSQTFRVGYQATGPTLGE